MELNVDRSKTPTRLNDYFREQVALLLDKLETFRGIMKRNGEMSNELYNIFAEIEALKRDSQLLQIEVDKRMREWKEGSPLIGTTSRQV